MSANGRLWIVALGAAVVGALLGAGAVWATQQQAIATLNVRVIKADADKQAALRKAEDLAIELQAAKASAGPTASGETSTTPSTPAVPKKPASKTVRQFTYIVQVTDPGGRPSIAADYAKMLTGAAAAAAATAHGDESPPPNDYYIVNDNKLRRKLPVKPGTRVTLTTNPDGTSDPTGREVTFESWASEFAATAAADEGLRASPYWITVKNGTVIKIEQQYLP